VAKELGATQVREVVVGGAFHTALMAAAQPRLRKALESTTFYDLAVPVVANVDALPHEGGGEWAALLSAQLRSPVRWRQSVLALAALMRTDEWDGDNLFCELGPRGPLSAFVRATLPEAATVPITGPDDLDTLVANLTGDTALQGIAEGHQGERLYVSERLVISPCAGIFELPPSAPTATEPSVPPATPPATPPAAPDANPPATAGGAAGPAPAATTEGTPVEIGDLLGTVSGTEVRSPFAGELMGVLAHPGERVQAGQPVAWLRAR
jgi:[acyl-carrier-protein] S-malonyltransferase